MKFISWNVNGLRACMGKGFMDSFNALDADFFCLQETKLQDGQITMDLPGYHQYWCYAEKKGYSGTAIFTRHEPRSVRYGLGIEELDTEGRVITLEYDEFFLVTCYTPNAQRGLARIDHRLKWEAAFRQFLMGLDAQKPVILCGDLNVAHKEIDLKNPSSNRGNAGFSDEERNAFSALLDCGFTDSFRHLYPDKIGAYSWWSYMFNARQNNAGWRIDYFVVSNRLREAIHDATIHPDILGSDHCPVGLDLNTTCNGSIHFPTEPTSEPSDEPKADGPSSVGLGIILPCLALIAILIGAFAFLPRLFSSSESSEPSVRPTTELVAIPPMERPLIAAVTDRTGNVTETVESDNPFSSALPRLYYVCGEERFLMGYILAEGPPKTPPNYHIQLAFTNQIVDTPTITAQVSHYSNHVRHYYQEHFYYNEDGTIGGCFLYGYLSHSATVSITVSNGENTDTVQVFVTPDFDLPSMKTAELAELVDSSKIVPTFLQDPQQDAFLQSQPILQELLSRTDAVSILLDYYRNSPNKYALSVASLLDSRYLQPLMTNEQRQTYATLKPSDQPLNATDSGVFQQITVYPMMPTIYYYAFLTAGSYSLELDGQSYSLHSTAGCINEDYNYCLRIDFSEAYHFTKDALPELSAIPILPEGSDTSDSCVHTNYFYQNGIVTGCFVYGHLQENAAIELMLTLKDHTTVSECLPISIV